MLSSSRNTLTDTSINIVPAIWAFLSPVKLIHVIKYHSSQRYPGLTSGTREHELKKKKRRSQDGEISLDYPGGP
jgi:hypothetical protein